MSTRTHHGPEVWAQVREAYLAGSPALEVSRRYGVTVAALRKRAESEGWSRKQAGRFQARPVVCWAPCPGRRLSRHELTVEQFKHAWPELWGEMEDIAGQAALEAVTLGPEAAIPLCDWAYRWRAEHFGPECAAADARLRPALDAELAARRRESDAVPG